MKKIFIICFAVLMLFSMAACGANEAQSSDLESSETKGNEKENFELAGSVVESSQASSSEDDSTEEADDGNLVINYTSVADGYIDHHLDFDFNILTFKGFKCMDDEVLFLPAGTVVICDSSLAIYCYDTVKLYKTDQLKYSTYLSEKIGQTVSPTKDVSPKSGTFMIEEDSIVRFSVRGDLSEVKIYPKKGDEGKVRLMTESACIEEFFNK